MNIFCLNCIIYYLAVVINLQILCTSTLDLLYAFALKVFTNEIRGGLRVISFDRPPFKLLSRKFSKESVQAPSSLLKPDEAEHYATLAWSR
jgi:hypothetical protein